MHQHTPGPWQWMKTGSDRPFLGTPDRGMLIVMDQARLGMSGAQPRFSVWKGHERGREGGIMRKASELDLVAHPDACLIAAAPTLLSALVDLLKLIETDQLVPESVSYMKEARAAVAKAMPAGNI